MVGEWGRAAAEKLYPGIDALQRKLTAAGNETPPEVRRVREQSVKIAEDWLGLYRDLRDKLLRLAAERRPADAVLRARPVEGEIDHTEFTRRIISRFPKILAELAK